MKRSAGILTYKIENNEIKVLLCHFGGPYWENIDIGAWSIPKGETINNEKILNTARREFSEETNLTISTTIDYLTSRKVSKNKLVIMFYTNSDFNLNICKSNTFKLEYPKGSNQIHTYPEMDKYKWFTLKEAKNIIIKNQLYFINKLEEILYEKSIICH